MPKSTFFDRFLFVISIFWISNSVAQNNNIDSLKQVINSKVHDTAKLKAIGFLLVNLPNSSKQYTYYNEKFKSTALYSIKTHKDKLVLEKSYDALGVYYVNKAYQSMQSDYLLTIKYLNKSLEFYNEKIFVTDAYTAARANILISLGVMYNKIGNTEKAINYYFEAMRYLTDASYISYAYQSIANLQNEQKKYREALKYYLKAYDVYYKKENLSFQDNIQKVLLFISIAKCHQELKDCELSESYLNKALSLAIKLNDNDVLSEIHFNLGQNEEICDRNVDNALAEYKKSLTYSKLPENNAESLIALGSLLVNQKKYSDAEKNLNKGLDFAKNIKNLQLQKKALENLYIVYKQQNKYGKALETVELFGRIKDSIKNEENDNTLTKKQLQYEYEVKQSQLKLAQERKLNAISLENQRKSAAQNTMLIGLLFLVFLLLIGAYFVYRNSKQKQAIATFEKNALNQKLLLSQMNPHFIFNSIDNIQSLIYNKQDKEAVNYLTKFSKLTRQILENSTESYISLDEELTMIDNYLVIQQLLYNNKFDFKINVDSKIDAASILFPPMLTQPFIENAIKHGLKSTTQKGLIDISFKFINEKLYFEITDNGSGFSDEEVGNRKSLAMKITKERLANFSAKANPEIQLENLFDDKKNVIGAKVFFEIPYIYEN